MIRHSLPLVLLTLACAAGTGRAEAGPPAPLAWSDVKAPGVTVTDEGDRMVASLELSASATAPVPVLTLQRPYLSENAFGLHGMVRLAGSGKGYLELWVSFEDGGRYFSRTQAPSGPTAWLAPTNEWRPFLVPFDATGATSPVSELAMNVVTEGGGTVQLADIALIEASSSQALFAAVGRSEGAWWSDRVGGLIGGSLGGLLGIFGALAGVLAARGRARGIVLTGAAVIAGLGAAAVAVGVAALATGQPYGVWFPLLLLGGLALVLGGFGRGGLARSYTSHELRRMRASDAV